MSVIFETLFRVKLPPEIRLSVSSPFTSSTLLTELRWGHRTALGSDLVFGFRESENRKPSLTPRSPDVTPRSPDAVEDVSQQVSVATDKEGNYEISIPLAALHWQPKPGAIYRADIGVLRGANGQTTQRVYWANKATAITADVPSEAELTPGLWGKWKIKAEN